jgi:hypothetical protein
MFPISNAGEDPLASNRCIVYTFDGVHQNAFGLFVGSSEDETLLRLQHAELREWLTEAILFLPEHERLVFTLHYYERLTTEEMKQCAGRDRIQHFTASLLRPIPSPRKPSESSQLCAPCSGEERENNSIAPSAAWVSRPSLIQPG